MVQPKIQLCVLVIGCEIYESKGEEIMDEIECSVCGGTGHVLAEIDPTKLMYGDYEIGKDWTKIENVWIWFQAFNRGADWRGIPGYVYETSDGYVAPFRGELLPVIKDTKNEFREAMNRHSLFCSKIN